MPTEILVKETTYTRFRVEKDITPKNFEENYELIGQEFDTTDTIPFDFDVEFALNIEDFDRLPNTSTLNTKDINDQEIQLKENGKTSTIVKFHKADFDHTELHICDKNGNLMRVVVL